MITKTIPLVISAIFCNNFYAAAPGLDVKYNLDTAGTDGKVRKPNIFFFFADDWGKYASTYNMFSPNKAIKHSGF
jgi:hypothetical protein